MFKRCRLYEEKSESRYLFPKQRGIYALYKEVTGKGKVTSKKAKREKLYQITYVGVGGIGEKQGQGMEGRIKNHRSGPKKKEDWTHYSIFEVHDNISPEEIRELEWLILIMFGKDDRGVIGNIQNGSKIFERLQNPSAYWKAA